MYTLNNYTVFYKNISYCRKKGIFTVSQNFYKVLGIFTYFFHDVFHGSIKRFILLRSSRFYFVHARVNPNTCFAGAWVPSSSLINPGCLRHPSLLCSSRFYFVYARVNPNTCFAGAWVPSSLHNKARIS